MKNKKTIFVVDDDLDILFIMDRWLTQSGYTVATFESGKQLHAHLLNDRPDLVFLDVNLQGEDGREICREIKQKMSTNIVVLLFSANPSALENHNYYNADGIVEKPFDLEDLNTYITKHLTARYN